MQRKLTDNLICTKTIIQILSYLRVEIDGTEVKNNLLQQNIQHCIRIADNTYKLEEKKTVIKTELEIRIKNKEGKKLFSFLLNEIYRIVDKQSSEGKLTLLIEKDKKKYNIMLFKSTKEVIEHFLGKLISTKNNLNNIKNDPNSVKSVSTEYTSEKNSKSNLINMNLKQKNNIYGKRRYNEL